MRKSPEAIAKGFLWACSLFFALAAIVYMPSLSSILFLLFAFLVVPIDSLKGVYPGALKAGPLRPVIAIVLVLAGILIVPGRTSRNAVSQEAIQASESASTNNSPSGSTDAEQAEESTESSESTEEKLAADEVDIIVKTTVLEYSNKEVDPLSLVSYDPVGGLSLSTEDHIDLAKLGMQEVHYLATLGDDRDTTVATFEVRDTKAPVISLVSDNVAITAGDPYEPKQNVQSVSDPVDGELPYVDAAPQKLESDELGRVYESGWYTLSGDFNANEAGKYYITVEACDNHGNKTTKAYSIEVAAPPASEPEPAPEPEPEPVAPIEHTYIANTNTKTFHYPSCRAIKKMNEGNKWEVTTTREDLIGQGYEPCGICNP